ncbi:DUF5590 domain-containing protein [Bacillaceae bacterium S4-13-58]
MRKQQFSRSIRRKRLKWIVISVLLFLFLGMGFFSYFYFYVQDQKEDDYAFAKQQALEGTPIKEIESTERFHGKFYYVTVYGVDEDNNALFAFVPMEDNDEDIHYVYKNEGVSQEEVLDYWNRECRDCSLNDIKLGFTSQIPVWELTYEDEHERYVFDYFRFDNGERYEQYRLKPNQAFR